MSEVYIRYFPFHARDKTISLAHKPYLLEKVLGFGQLVFQHARILDAFPQEKHERPRRVPRHHWGLLDHGNSFLASQRRLRLLHLREGGRGSQPGRICRVSPLHDIRPTKEEQRTACDDRCGRNLAA